MRRSWCAVMAAIFVVSSAAACAAAPAFVSGRVTLRDGPGTNFPAIVVIPAGTEVEILGCERGWCEAELGDAEGFIRQDLLNFLDAGPPLVVFPPVVFQYGFRYWREHDRGGWNTWRRDRGRPERGFVRPPGGGFKPRAGRAAGPLRWRWRPTGPLGRPIGWIGRGVRSRRRAVDRKKVRKADRRAPAPGGAPGGPPQR